MIKSKPRKRPDRALTPKQELFCQHYVQIGNASQAYRLSYPSENKKQTSIWRSAFEILHNPKIQSRIAQLQEEQRQKSLPTKEKVERVLMDIVGNDPADIFYVDEATGKLRQKTPVQLSKSSRNAIKRIVNNRGSITIDFNDKVAAATLLAKLNAWMTPTEVVVDAGEETLGAIKLGFGKKED